MAASGSYSEDALLKKLERLTNTPESIQTLAQWLIYHRKKHKQSVEVWERYTYKCKESDKKMLLMYLANEVMQTSRKKGGEFIKEFGRALPNACLNLFRYGTDEQRQKLLRMLTIWEQRRVFPIEYVNDIRQALDQRSKGAKPPGASAPALASPAPVTTTTTTSATAAPALPLHPIAKALAELEKTAALDQMMSNKIDQLDFESVVSRGDAATRLAATTLLTQYTSQLDLEVQRRRAAADLMTAYLQEQIPILDRLTRKQADLAKHLNSLHAQSAAAGATTAPPAGQKRPGDDLDQPASKRPRVDGGSSPAPGLHVPTLPSFGPLSPSPTAAQAGVTPYTPTAAGMSPTNAAGKVSDDVMEVDMDLADDGGGGDGGSDGSVFGDTVAPAEEYQPDEPTFL